MTAQANGSTSLLRTKASRLLGIDDGDRVEVEAVRVRLRTGLGALLARLVDNPHERRTRDADGGEIERETAGRGGIHGRDAARRRRVDDLPPAAVAVRSGDARAVARLKIDGRRAREGGPGDPIVAHAHFARLGVRVAGIAADP